MDKILIAHKGNLFGVNKERENTPDYLLEAINKGYDVETDVWYVDKAFYLGHDKPEHKIDLEFLFDERIWAHAKNVEALLRMNNECIHCFWHQTDDVVLTSNYYLWTYPGKQIASNRAIAVLPEVAENWDIEKAVGICSDYIGNYGKSGNHFTRQP